jgi:hypothetical protein
MFLYLPYKAFPFERTLFHATSVFGAPLILVLDDSNVLYHRIEDRY